MTGCLKGTNKKNFLNNARLDLYEYAIKELQYYVEYDNFYLTLIGYDDCDLEKIYDICPKYKIDLLKIVDYEVVKYRRQNGVSDVVE